MVTSKGNPWWHSFSYSWPEEKHGTLTTTGSGVQAMLIPCFPPLNGRGRLLNYYFSNGTATAGTIVFWDAYLSDPTGFTTNGTVGAAATPVWQVNLPASQDVSAICLQEKAFQCGVVLQSTIQPVFYSIQLAITALG